MPRPQRPNQAQNVPKPYDFVSFPEKPPTLKAPAGHHKYDDSKLHGTIYLELTVETAVHVSTGTVMMGSDVGQNRIPLIKTMMQSGERLTIPGSSLKGSIRSTYEAITGSCLCKVKTKGKQKKKQSKGKVDYSLNIPQGYKECIPKKEEIESRRVNLCPACKIFGAMNFQGLVNFMDAIVNSSETKIGFMPSLYEPSRECKEYYVARNPQYSNNNSKLNGTVVGRKFFYHAKKAVSGGDRGIPVQQANAQYTFSTQLHFKNLTQAELGTLFVALGQDKKYPFALKVGAGKPIGMGTMTVKVSVLEKPNSLRDRYSSYTQETPRLEGTDLQEFVGSAIATAHRQKLIELPQLQQLHQILQYPTDREAPSGMY
ncbi:MAG: RAMP superfamily CRISPR-associated protein [Jaaginema sp. PMC 1079.18]|nr:RAMP superfamily CRISPR-associated protein [Jaaginema sp. PMC 1080.18]MEC4849743.1 RAMP superfamily CRISPR-associated protein [Jaaginema sp. PMC 1079.18]MEC4867487.1 RAMP superfamily CRISPR-associated protein [Jaaginema sp. PMC 1078.18]